MKHEIIISTFIPVALCLHDMSQLFTANSIYINMAHLYHNIM